MTVGNASRLFGRRGWARARVWVLPVVALAAACSQLLTGGKWGVDTGMYAAIAVRAFDAGDWWTLRKGDEFYFNKPPLGFWVLGAFLRVLGHELWVIRASTVAIAAACVLASVGVARELFGRRHALLSGLVLALTLEFFRLTERPKLDYLLALLLMLAVWCVAAGAKRARPGLLVLGGVPIGLGLLVKPFVALAALPILAVWLVRSGRGRLAWWLGPAGAVAVAIAAPWHVSMVLLHGEAFREAYLGRETLHRVTGAAFETEPWWWYGDYALRTYWPWLLAAVPAFAWWARGAGRERRGEGIDLAALWSLAWIAGISLIPDKHKHYMIPAYPALSWLIAAWMLAALPRTAHRAGRRWADAVVFGALALAVGIKIGLDPTRDTRRTDWPALYEALRATSEPEVWNAGLSDADAGMLYVMTGVRTRVARDPEGHPDHPPPGVLAVYNLEFRRPPEGVEPFFTEGKFALVRTPGAGP